MVLASGVRLSLLGIAIGVAMALLLTRVLATFVYRVSTTDPATLGACAALLVAAAAAASWIPAWRAVRLDPSESLR
jgi:ABC-type antimicrobial peptide transport system permease subunit